MNSKHLLSIALSTTIAFSASSQSYAACCLQPPANYPLPAGSIRPTAVAFSPLNNALVTANVNADSNNVTFFKMNNGILQLPGIPYTISGDNQVPQALAFSPLMRISQYVAVGSNGEHPGTARVTIFKQVSNGLQYVNERTLPSNSGFITGVAFSSNGMYLAAVSDLHKVTLFRMTSSGLDIGISYSLPASSYPSSVAFSRDSSYLVTANSFTNKVTLFKMISGTLQLVNTYDLPPGCYNPRSIAFSPNSLFVATANRNSDNVTIFKLINGVLTEALFYPLGFAFTKPVSLSFSKDGTCLAVATEGGGATEQGGVAQYTVSANGALLLSDIRSLTAARNPQGIALSPDNPFLVATANYDSNNVSIFKTTC